MTTTPPEAPTPIINPIPIPPDTRPIADMPFEGGDETRNLLTRCAVTVAHEIETVGCTGATKFGLSLDEIRSLRLGLAGGGVGLPCFVDKNYYCLAHNTIGGLQHEQLQRYPEFAEGISRPLTKREAGHVAFTEAVRHSTDANAGIGDRISTGAGMFSGYGDMPRGTEMIEEEEVPTSGPEMLPVSSTTQAAATFRCPEHTSLVWTCRFCVAQSIANGELEPSYYVFQPAENGESGDGESVSGVNGSELMTEIDERDAKGAKVIEIYVLAKTLTRRLG